MELVTVHRAAKLKGVSEHVIRYWLRTGLLQGVKPGRDWLIDRVALDRFVKPPRGRPPVPLIVST